MGNKYQLFEYINGCNQDLCNLRGQIHDVEKAIEAVENITGLEKILHRSKIKARLKHLYESKARLEHEYECVQLELENYNRHGIDYYLHGPGKNDEFQTKRLDARTTKMEVIEMVELGLM